jgi:hypothetical protein
LLPLLEVRLLVFLHLVPTRERPALLALQREREVRRTDRQTGGE